MRNIFVILSFVCFLFTQKSFAQQVRRALGDTTTVKKTLPEATKTPTVAPIKKAVIDTMPEAGVAVSPSTMRFNVKPGALQTKTLRITNDTKKSYSFQIAFQDYGAGKDGSSDVPVDKYSMYALSKYIVVSPTFIELKPRESKQITVTLDVPAGDSMAVSMWTILTIDQVLEREKLNVPRPNSTIGMGVQNTFGFGINIFQNPPNVTVTNVEIISMAFNKKLDKKGNSIQLKVKNMGTGIGYCLNYVELTNLVTGKQEKLKVKQFAIFPSYEKELLLDLPFDLEKGPYSAMAVLDFGNKDELQTAEIEFAIE